jgi:alpha-1,3-glucosyltransferase
MFDFSIIALLYRYPRTLICVVMDMLEKLYLAGFPVMFAATILFPVYMSRRSQAANGDGDGSSKMDFLPLMVTSVYCAIGIVWGYLRLLFVYLNEETTYQGQLSSIR